MDPSMVADSAQAVPLPSVPVGRGASVAEGPLVLRISTDEEADLALAFPLERVAWLETDLRLAERFASSPFAVDVVLRHPDEAPSLYRISSLFGERLPRVTIPARIGIARAGAIAMALQFIVRIVAEQPDAAEVFELEELLERYLHDPLARTPVEFFHSRLLGVLHGAQPSLWDVLERDPDLFPRLDPGPHDPPQQAGFVARHVERLRGQGAECTVCPFLVSCKGYFKWPDPAYDCENVRRLLTRLDVAAGCLRQDLMEAEAE